MIAIPGRLLSALRVLVPLCLLLALTPDAGALATVPRRQHLAGNPSASLSPGSLRTEMQASPIGLPTAHPRLSWQSTSVSRAAAQSGYQVAVSSTETNAGNGVSDVWDSGRVASADSTVVLPDAIVLASFTSYWWRVTVWDVDGVSSVSTVARFSTGALAAQDWIASDWIEVAGYTRRDITLSQAPVEATMIVVAKGLKEHGSTYVGYGKALDYYRYGLATGTFVTHVNGSRYGTSSGASDSLRVGDVILEPGQSDTDLSVVTRSYDLTGRLVAGANVIGFESALATDVRALIVLRDASGVRTVIGTDGSWRSSWGPYLSAHRFNGVTYDSHLAIPGWDSPATSDARWRPARVVTSGNTVAERNAALSKEYTRYRPIVSSSSTELYGWSLASVVDGVDESRPGAEGFHSAIIPAPPGATSCDVSAKPETVSIDLSGWASIGAIRLVAANPTNVNGALRGIGFPMRFRIEAALESTFANPTVVVDRTAADVAVPPTGQLELSASGNPYRFVRLVATKLPVVAGRAYCALALAEISVGPARRVPVVTAGTETALVANGWAPDNLVDGQASRTGNQGYASKPTANANDTASVMLDFGRNIPVGAITLTPAQPTNYLNGNDPGHGFPVRYRLERATNCTSGPWTIIADRTSVDQPNPGSLGVVVRPATSISARCIRLTATKLFRVANSYSLLALAEMSVAEPTSAPTIRPAILEPIRVVGEHEPVAVTHPDSNTTVFDFGVNRVGMARLRVVGASTARATQGASAIVTIAGEELAANGFVSIASIQAPSYGLPTRQQNSYTFTSGPSGYLAPFDWAPDIIYQGFRYVQITGATDVAVTQLTAHTAVADGGDVQTDGFVSVLQQAVRQTQLNNLHSVPEDCPTREKRGWFGDAWTTAPEAMSNFSMSLFFESFAQQIGENTFRHYTPSDTYNTDSLVWSAAAVLIPWDLYRRTGNRRVLEQSFANMVSTVTRAKSLAASSAPVRIVNESGIADHLAPRTETALPDLVRTAVYFHSASVLDKVAAVLGRQSEPAVVAVSSDSERAAIRDAFNVQFRVSDASGVRYGRGTQAEAAMALVWGLVPDADATALGTYLVNRVGTTSPRLLAGIIGLPVVLEALDQLGRNDLVLAYLTNTDPAINVYAKMLADGSGTIWEDPFKAGDANFASRNHPAFGSVGQWIYEGLLGVQPIGDTPGYQNVSIHPGVASQPVAGHVVTPVGNIVIASSPVSKQLTVTIPVGITAIVDVPTYGITAPTITESGTVLHDANGPTGSLSAGVTSVGTVTTVGTERFVPLVVGSGTYVFEVVLAAQ